MSNRKNWKPLERVVMPNHRDWRAPESLPLIEEIRQAYPDKTVEEIIDYQIRYDASCTFWTNDLYQVQYRTFYNESFKQEMVHLNIRRRDGAAVFDWRHRQWIKNQLVGEECEGFEVYPAESRLSDTSNKYHLFCFTNPAVRMPVHVTASDMRDVIEHEVKSPPGMRQRRM